MKAWSETAGWFCRNQNTKILFASPHNIRQLFLLNTCHSCFRWLSVQEAKLWSKSQWSRLFNRMHLWAAISSLIYTQNRVKEICHWEHSGCLWHCTKTQCKWWLRRLSFAKWKRRKKKLHVFLLIWHHCVYRWICRIQPEMCLFPTLLHFQIVQTSALCLNPTFLNSGHDNYSIVTLRKRIWFWEINYSYV